VLQNLTHTHTHTHLPLCAVTELPSVPHRRLCSHACRRLLTPLTTPGRSHTPHTDRYGTSDGYGTMARLGPTQVDSCTPCSPAPLAHASHRKVRHHGQAVAQVGCRVIPAIVIIIVLLLFILLVRACGATKWSCRAPQPLSCHAGAAPVAAGCCTCACAGACIDNPHADVLHMRPLASGSPCNRNTCVLMLMRALRSYAYRPYHTRRQHAPPRPACTKQDGRVRIGGGWPPGPRASVSSASRMTGGATCQKL